MKWFDIVFIFIVFLGALTLTYYVYKLTVLDAKSRGLKHPHFWGIFTMGGGNNRGNLILYLLGRRNYPSSLSEQEKQVIESYKKRIGVCLIFIVVGTIGLILSKIVF